MIYYQVASLIVGALLALFSLYIDSTHGKWKRAFQIGAFLSIITALGISTCIAIKEDENKEKERDDRIKDQALLLSNFATTLQKADTSIKKADTSIENINTAIDSLKSVQKITDSIIKNTIVQLNLQNSALDSSHSILQKNESLLIGQTETYKKVDRLLNPFFPINIRVRMNISLDDTSLSQFSNIFEEVKNDFENKNGLETNRYRYVLFPIFEGDKIKTLQGNVDSFSFVSSIISSLIDTLYISFYLTNERDPLRILYNVPQTRFALYNQGKFGHCTRIFIIDYERRLLFIEFSYEDDEFVIFGNTIYGNKLGISDIMNSYLALNNPVISNLRFNEISFFKKGRQDVYGIKFNDHELIGSDLFNNKVSEFYIHKIVNSDVYYLR